jgi:hypothetical protein
LTELVSSLGRQIKWYLSFKNRREEYQLFGNIGFNDRFDIELLDDREVREVWERVIRLDLRKCGLTRE